MTVETNHEKGGIELFLNQQVILWVKDTDLPKPKPKYGTLISYDHTHIILRFNRGSLSGRTLAFNRDTVIRIDPDNSTNDLKGGQD